MKKKTLLKTFFVILATVLLLSVFASCGKDAEDVAQSNGTEIIPEESTGGSEDAPTATGALTLVLRGKSDYKIVYPENCDSFIIDQANALRKHVREKTRANVEVVSDGGATQKGLSDYEILIGKTNREESASAYDHLDYNGSKAFISGTKIVLAAHNSTSMSEAASALIKQMRSPKNENTITVAKLNSTKSGTYAVKKLTFGNDDAWSFGIVASGEEELALANNIRSLIGEASGVVLNVYSSKSELPTGIKPFYIGSTETPAGDDNTYYRIGAVSGGIALYCDSARSRTEAFTDFQNALALESADSLDILSAVSPKQKQENEQGKATDLKIMSFNVLNGWSSANIGNRDDLTAEQILAFMPDVLCMQEFDKYYRHASGTPLSTLIADKYTESAPSVESWNPIFYNKDTLTLVTRGHKDYSEGTAYNYPGGGMSKFRTINWALFEHKETGKQFLVFNTHLDIEANLQLIQVSELNALVSELRSLFGLNDIFLTGDLNSKVSSDTAKGLFNFGFKDTHDIAAVKDDLDSENTQGAAITEKYASAIDHVYYISENVTVSEYKTVTDIRSVSDHCPICVTLKLEK